MDAIYSSLSDYLDARDNMADLSDEQRQQIAATAAATAAAVADTALVLNQIASDQSARLRLRRQDVEEDVEVPRRHQPCSVTTLVSAQHDGDRYEHVSRSKSPKRSHTHAAAEEETTTQQHHHQLHAETYVVSFFAGDVAVRSQEHPEQEIRLARAVEAPAAHEDAEVSSPKAKSPLPPPPPPAAVSEDEEDEQRLDEQTHTRLSEEALEQAAAMADDLGAEGLAEPVIAGTISDQMIEEAEREDEEEEENERPSASRQSSLLSLTRPPLPPPPAPVPASTSKLSQSSSHWARRREIKEARQEQGRRLAEQAALHRTKNQKSTRVTKSQRAGVVFPVTRVLAALKKLEPHRRVTEVAGVYLCSTLEYLCAELLELGGNAALAYKRNRITPRHLFLAVQQDAEFFELLKDVTMRQGGVLPNIPEALLDTKKNVAKTMPKNEARVEAAKKAAATRKRNAAAAAVASTSTSVASKKKPAATTGAARGRRKAESEVEELVHEARVEAGKKAAASRKKYVKSHHLEREEHEKHVKAGKKAALARKKHELGLEPKKSEYEAIDREPLTEEEEEEEEEETTHEKRVRAGKKGAEARKRHRQEQEQEEGESEPPASQESSVSRAHAKHVAAGKKGAETRKQHLLELIEQAEHEKHVQAGKKAAETRRRHKEEREAGEDDDEDSEYSVEEEEETEDTEETEETEEAEEETPRTARKRARDQYEFKAATGSSGKAVKRSRSIDEIKSAAKRRSSRSISDTDVSELDSDIKKRRIEKRMLMDECHQLAAVKAALVHDIEALEKPKPRARKQKPDPAESTSPPSETSEAAPTTNVELSVTKVASVAAETGLQAPRET